MPTLPQSSTARSKRKKLKRKRRTPYLVTPKNLADRKDLIDELVDIGWRLLRAKL